MIFYDRYGNRIKKVKKKDFDDYSATGSANLYTDNRVIHYNYVPISYPYTVVYEYEKHHKYTAFIPQWMPIRSYEVGVINSSYTGAQGFYFSLLQKLTEKLTPPPTTKKT